MTTTNDTLALIEAVRSMAVDWGIVTSPAIAGGNILQDDPKLWQVNIHRNRLVKIISGVGRGQEAIILGNMEDSLTINGRWLQAIGAGAIYVILETDVAQAIRDVLGGGANISIANPLPVAGVITSANMIIDPFTNATGLNINPVIVRSSTTDAFRLCKVQCHFAAATSNPITIALDAAQGVLYDKTLIVITMGASQDADRYFPDSAKFEAGDVITVAWTNDIGAISWSVEIGWEE